MRKKRGIEYFHANLEVFGIEERHMKKAKELLENSGSWYAFWKVSRIKKLIMKLHLNLFLNRLKIKFI